MKNLWNKWNNNNLVVRIIAGIFVGALIALMIPDQTGFISTLGTLFVGALKAIAPVLVFFLVLNAVTNAEGGKKSNIKTVIMLYAISTVIAGAVAVVASTLFPTKITLKESAEAVNQPNDVFEVLETVMFNIVSNPVTAIMEANYIGILAWAVLLGVVLKASNEVTKTVVANISDGISKIVQWVIAFAPFGIMGLMYDTIASNGLTILGEYSRILIVLVGSMLVVAFITNPILAYVFMRKNPYPLIFMALKESGITAFFTRSSAANIPLNMKLCEKLGLNKATYSVAIPLGSTVNMAGAAVTISVLTLATVHTLGIQVDIPTALILVVLSAVSAAGASGVAGGSLLLIPIACSLFGIPNDVAMQVVAIGFVISVVQDSFETAVNSSSDVVFVAVAEEYEKRK